MHVDLLISLVESRPAVWDKTSDPYEDGIWNKAGSERSVYGVEYSD